jgi:hypothetical protein
MAVQNVIRQCVAKFKHGVIRICICGLVASDCVQRWKFDFGIKNMWTFNIFWRLWIVLGNWWNEKVYLFKKWANLKTQVLKTNLMLVCKNVEINVSIFITGNGVLILCGHLYCLIAYKHFMVHKYNKTSCNLKKQKHCPLVSLTSHGM